MPEVNWIAVALCAVSSLVLGGIWYSPMLFARPWQQAAGLRAQHQMGAVAQWQGFFGVHPEQAQRRGGAQ